MPNILKQWLADLSPDCRNAVRLHSHSMDGKLSWRQYLGLKVHLCLCQWCRRYARQLELLRGAAHDLDEKCTTMPSDKLPADARERIKRSLTGK